MTVRIAPVWVAPDRRPGVVLRECLQAAIAAPSIHNSQPWCFRTEAVAGGVDVLADRARRLHVIDPRGRELLISVGAAILNLRIAMLAHGRQPQLRLFPSPAEPDLVARITPVGFTHGTETVAALARAIPRRHTNRWPFADLPVPAKVLRELAMAARAEGAELTVADESSGEAILGVVRKAEARWRADPGYWAELASWTMATNGRSDGVPPEAFGPWSAAEALPLRDFGLVQPGRRRRVTDFERSPVIVVLSTVSDSPEVWVRAGQALERVLLTATVRGLANTPMTQALEIPEFRRLIEDTTEGRVAQAVLRLGYGPPAPPSPRRPLDEVLLPA